MGILQFRRPITRPVIQVAGADWSQQELADFYRAHRLLVQNGVAIGLDRGLSDTGDPWMVFYDTASEDVFLHIARFDRCCILVSETLRLHLSRASITDLIVAFEEAVRDITQPRREQSANVLLHPAARIIMSLSAVFLMFKLENGGVVHARPALDTAASDAVRKADHATSSRPQQALARLLDITDAPGAAAAIAGAILSVELARIQIAQDQQASDAKPSIALHHEQTQPIELSSAAELVLQPDIGNATPALSDASLIREQSPNELLSAIELLLDAAKLSPFVTQTAHFAAMAFSADLAQAQAGAEDSRLHTATAAIIPEMSVQGDATSVAVAVADSMSKTVSVPEESLATSAVQSLLAELSFSSAGLPDITTEPEASKVALGEVSLGDLSWIGSSASLSLETALEGEFLTSRIAEILTRFGHYEVEFASGQVMIEQFETATLSAEEVGIWTNVMTDGSAISVIGQAELLSELTTGLA